MEKEQPLDESPETHEHIIEIPEGGGSTSTSSASSIEIENQENNVNQPCSSSSGRPSTTDYFPSFWVFWFSFKLITTLSQIIASVIVLVVARHEKPNAPLFAWIVVYAAGRAASLPIFFRLYFMPYPRLCKLVDRYKWALEFFDATWFIIGNYWIFGGYSSSEAPNLYRLSVVFLTFGYIKYATPFVIIVIFLCRGGGLNQIRGATAESINALPTYKFKLQKNGNGNGSGTGMNSKGDKGGVLAAGTEKERAVSGDNAVCSICLENYADNDELKEMPCSHFFHVSCVDQWLKIKAFCPLCKLEIG